MNQPADLIKKQKGEGLTIEEMSDLISTFRTDPHCKICRGERGYYGIAKNPEGNYHLQICCGKPGETEYVRIMESMESNFATLADWMMKNHGIIQDQIKLNQTEIRTTLTIITNEIRLLKESNDCDHSLQTTLQIKHHRQSVIGGIIFIWKKFTRRIPKVEVIDEFGIGMEKKQ